MLRPGEPSECILVRWPDNSGDQCVLLEVERREDRPVDAPDPGQLLPVRGRNQSPLRDGPQALQRRSNVLRALLRTQHPPARSPDGELLAAPPEDGRASSA